MNAYLRDFGTDYRVILTMGAHGIIGHINTPTGPITIESDSGKQWLVDMAHSGLLPHDDGQHNNAISADMSNAANLEQREEATRQLVKQLEQLGREKAKTHPMYIAEGSVATAPAPAPTTTATTTTSLAPSNLIDVLVIYSDGLAARLGTSLSARLDFLFATANQALIDSGIN